MPYPVGVRPWIRRGLLAAIAAPVLAGTGWLGVGWTVTSIANGALASRGMACDPVDVGFALDLSRADLGPTRCTFTEGPIAELRLTGEGHARLDDAQRVTRVEASGIELDLRHDPPRDMVEGLVEEGEVPPRLRDSLRALTGLAARDDVPSLAIRRVLLRRRALFVTFRRVAMTREDGALVITVASAGPPPIGGERVHVEGQMVGLEIRATRAEVHVAGRLEVDAALPRRELHERVPFAFHATGLDGEAPTYAVELELSEGLRALRERHERRVAEQAAAAAAPPEPPARERIRAMRDSLRETVASLRE